MNSLSLPVVHPAFRRLKNSGRVLHLIAGGLILTHAFTHLKQADTLYFWCQLIIALDIIVLVFAARNLPTDLPKVNLFFRSIEVLFFLGTGILLILKAEWLTGCIHSLLSAAYIYLFYCERKLDLEEYVGIHHTGITLPALPESKFLIWSHINEIDAHYNSITVNTSSDKSYHFDLQKNLEFEELDQIHEFCRHYLGSVC